MGNVLKHINYKHSKMKVFASTLLAAAAQAVQLEAQWEQPTEHTHDYYDTITKYRTEQEPVNRYVPYLKEHPFTSTQYRNEGETKFQVKYRDESKTITVPETTTVWKHGVRDKEITEYRDEEVEKSKNVTKYRDVLKTRTETTIHNKPVTKY